MGFGREHTMDAHVCVRKGGGMDEELFISTVLFYISLYPNIRLMFKWLADGKTLLYGPMCIKTNSGNGPQTKSKINFQFRHGMHQMGVYIGPGLPSSTAAAQEMDDLYKTSKNMCHSTSQDFFMKKTHSRGRRWRTWKKQLQRVRILKPPSR